MKACIWLQRLSPLELIGSIYGCAFALDDGRIDIIGISTRKASFISKFSMVDAVSNLIEQLAGMPGWDDLDYDELIGVYEGGDPDSIDERFNNVILGNISESFGLEMTWVDKPNINDEYDYCMRVGARAVRHFIAIEQKRLEGNTGFNMLSYSEEYILNAWADKRIPQEFCRDEPFKKVSSASGIVQSERRKRAQKKPYRKKQRGKRVPSPSDPSQERAFDAGLAFEAIDLIKDTIGGEYEEAISGWEKDEFVPSINNQLIRSGSLSRKQMYFLMRIAKRIRNRMS